MGDSCPSGSSEGVTFEEREIRCPGIVSTSKLDEGSHQYELLGNIEHGGVLFTNAEPPISQKGSGNLRMQADKMYTVIAERDPSVPNEPIEADISSSAQADCLRFEVEPSLPNFIFLQLFDVFLESYPILLLVHFKFITLF